MRAVCCHVAVGITLWTILHLKAFIWSCLPSEERAQDSYLVEDVSCDQKLQLGMGESENYTIISFEKQDAGGHLPAPSYLLARSRRWEQRSFC